MDTVIGWLKDLGGWLVVTIAGLVLVGVLYLLGKTGTVIRKGVETKKALRKVRAEASQKGMTVNDKWREMDGKATRWIWMPVVAWAVVYAILFFLLPSAGFAISLLGLVVPLLGFFGILFAPDLD